MMEMLTYMIAFINALFSFAYKKLPNFLALIVSFFVFIKCLEPFLIQWRYEKKVLDNKNIAEAAEIKIPSLNTAGNITTGNVSVSNNVGPTQVNIGSPGSKQIVNQQRTVRPDARIEKGKKGALFLLRIILNQTSGIWDQGTDFAISLKTSAPYKTCEVVSGLPPAQFNVRISENKEAGEYTYATTTAPMKDEPIIVEIISEAELNILKLGVQPLATS